MTEIDPALLDELARRRGLGEAYYDHRGELKYFSKEARIAILKAMGVDMESLASLDGGGTGWGRLSSEMPPPQPSAADAGEGVETCYQPPILAEKKCWGLSIQLYTLRSSRNWGIGDFADLRGLIALAAPLGCDVIGLNPLHALFPAAPQLCSPYSPSSRLFLNVLYVAVDDVPELEHCAAAQDLCAEPSFQAALDALRASDYVRYEQAASLKLRTLRLLHDEFRRRQLNLGTARARAFRHFVSEGGEPLRLHALFDALDAHLRTSTGGGWQAWPVEYRNPASGAVRDFSDANAHEIEFFLYAQWLADEQLAAAQDFARTQGMRIGLYGDLAVGASPDGSEVWSNQSLYVQDASVGAPPDPLALSGQDWGIPPIDPQALRVQAFRPFVELVRDNMHRMGALRIDHVMSLFRLWWVPRGFSAVQGVYVHYPLDALVTLLARESAAAQCLVIGEDLGTVPDEVRHAMTQYQLYHYKVLLFEKHGDGRFKPPHDYLHHAVATATTHDLPPLKAWWRGEDLELRDRLGLYPSDDVAMRLHRERETDRVELLRALREARLWHWRDGEPLPEFSAALARAIHLYLGATQAALVLVQLEDLIGMTDPVNVPGTHTEHANWQRKLTVTTADIFARAEVRETLAALGKSRAGADPNGS